MCIFLYGLWSRGLGWVTRQGCAGVAVRGFTLEKILSRKIPLKALQTYSFWAGNPWSSLKSLLFTLSLSFTSKPYRIRWGSGGGNWFLMLTRALCSSIPELAGEHLRYSSESKRIKIQFYSKCLLISLLRMCAACHIRGNTQIFCSVRFCQSKADVFAINGVRRRAERGKSKNNIRNNSNLGSSKSLS